MLELIDQLPYQFRGNKKAEQILNQKTELCSITGRSKSSNKPPKEKAKLLVEQDAIVKQAQLRSMI